MRVLFERDEEWEAFWRTVPGRSAGGRDRLDQAGHFLAGAMLVDGFRLFPNGGVPLLERRNGPFIEEIVLRSAAYRSAEGVLPVRVDLHLSHQGLREIRWPYWRPNNRIPISVISADLGALHDPAGRLVWMVGETSVALEDLSLTVARLALPWFARFRRPWTLCDALSMRQVPLIDHFTSVELILAIAGRKEAHQYLNEHVVQDERFWRAIEELGQPREPHTEEADPFLKLASIAQLCHLL